MLNLFQHLSRMRVKHYYVYITTNKSATLYIGVTNDLKRRMWEDKNKVVLGFTEKYNIDRLIYYEEFADINEALQREKQLKNWHRKWKIELVKKSNPKFEEIVL